MESSKRPLVLSFVGLCCLNVLVSIDATALSVSLPTIARALDATSVQAYWSGTAFVLCSAVFQPVFAAFSNGFGRKPVVLAALLLFLIGTIVCATARNINMLLAGRTIQGAGGGGMLTMTYVLMADLLSQRDRAKGSAVISLVWLVGTVCGPILGGGFTAQVSWRCIFWFNLFFIGISFTLISFCLRTPHRSLHPLKALRNVDWLGAIVFVGSLTSFLIALSWGGAVFQWSSWHTLVPLVVGVPGLVSWVIYEHHIPRSPIVPIDLLSNRTACAAYFGTVIHGLVQFALLYYLPLYYQAVKGYSPLISGVALLPQCVGSGPTTAVTGMLIAKTGRYRAIIWLGWVVLVLGLGLLQLLGSNSTIPQWIFLNAVSGIGLGLLFASQATATQAAAKDEHMAIAAGLNPFFRAIGQALGIVVGDAIFQNRFKSRLLSIADPVLRSQAQSLATDSAGLASYVQGLPDSSPERIELVQAFVVSLQAVWWAMLAFAVLAGITSLLIREISLDRSPAETQKPTALDPKSIVDAEKGLTSVSVASSDSTKAGDVTPAHPERTTPSLATRYQQTPAIGDLPGPCEKVPYPASSEHTAPVIQRVGPFKSGSWNHATVMLGVGDDMLM